MWTLSMFFWEIRALFSLFLLGYVWYKMGLLDLYLRYLLVKEIEKVAKLPVEVDSVTCYLSGNAIVKGVHVYAPLASVDSRWELDHILTGNLSIQ
jgi:hypothetical protein